MTFKSIFKIALIHLFFILLFGCAKDTSSICVYGIDSLTDGANGKSYRTFFDSSYNNFFETSEPGFIHFDYATSKDENIGYWKSKGIKNMASSPDYSIDPVKYSFAGKGVYGFDLNNDSFIYNTRQKEFKNVRIYYLQRPDGGSFKFRFVNKPKSKGIYQSMKGDFQLKFVELNKTSISDSIINIFEINGNAAFFGGHYYNRKNNEQSSASTLNIAKGGMSLNKVMTLDREFRRKWYSEFKPNVVLFNAGTNDRIKVNEKAFKTLLSNYIEDVKKGSPDSNFILVEPNQTADYQKSFANEYTLVRKQLASEKKLELLDIPELIGDYNYFVENNLMNDGVHPNEEGFKLISKISLEFLNSKL
ncbi:MAG: hypothetical protein BM564_00780 [Bacteroidetes bacterium MedPE-SWsnd-G2]|nr:MAG: hypothetical protein BM564_00780 [Bacteroidetes bacterium MedPE-SWsnd-G2]